MIWALGTLLSEGQQHLDFLLAAAEAFATHLLPDLRQQGKGFRFVNVSGMFAEKDEGSVVVVFFFFFAGGEEVEGEG